MQDMPLSAEAVASLGVISDTILSLRQGVDRVRCMTANGHHAPPDLFDLLAGNLRSLDARVSVLCGFPPDRDVWGVVMYPATNRRG